MKALDNGMQASTVGAIYTSKYSAPCTSFCGKKVFLFCLNTLLKALTKEKKDKNKIQIILIRTCLIFYYDKLLSRSNLFTQE